MKNPSVIKGWVAVLGDGRLAALPDDVDARIWLRREDAVYDALGFHNAKVVRATLSLVRGKPSRKKARK